MAISKSKRSQTHAALLRRCFAALIVLLSLSVQAQGSESRHLGDTSGKPYSADEEVLRQALSEAETTFGAESAQVFAALQKLVVTLSRDSSRRKEVVDLLERSLAICEKILGPDHVAAANSLDNLARIYVVLGRYAEAVPKYQRSLAIREKTLGPDHVDVANSLNNLALLHKTMGRYAQALPLYQRSLAIRERSLDPEHLDVAVSLNNLASLHEAMSNYGEAQPLYQRSLAILEKSLGPEHPYTAHPLSNLAWLQQQMGHYAQALALYQRSLTIREKALDPEDPDVASTLNNLASLHHEMGHYAQALPLYLRSTAILEKALGPEHTKLAGTLNNLALLQERMGNYAEALPLYQRSMAINEKALGPDHPEVANSLHNLALLHMAMGHYAQALPLYQRSLAIWEKVLGPKHSTVATSLNSLASLHEAMGHYADALPLYQRSLAIREAALGSDHPTVAAILTNQGHLHLILHAFNLAGTALRQAVTLSQSHPGGRETLWRSQYILSELNNRLNQPDLAILWGKEAVNTIQDLRAGLTSLDKDLQVSFLTNKRHVYQHLADLLIEQGRLTEAQTVLQMLKEQELHDSLERAATTDPRSTRIELTGLERKRFAKYYELRDQQLELGLERERLERKKKVSEINDSEKRRLDEINNKLLPPLRAAMVAFLDALQKSASELAKQEQRRADPDLKLVETNLQRAMQQVQRGTSGIATAALQFVVTDTRLSILLSTPGAPPLARQIEVSAKSLRQKVMAARELVSRPPGKLPVTSNPEFLNKPLRELYALLIAPIEADLKSLGVKTLILVPNDVLRYVPFAALMNGDRYLVQDYTLALFNEAVKRDFAPKVSTIWRPAAMGLTRAVANLPALPAVREEVEVVALNAGMTGQAFLDDDFNRATLTKVLGQDFNVLHLASHFDLVPGRPDASRLFLGDLSALTLGDIARDNLRFDRFSLVAFSACETGLGDTELADGRDMESLGALVQNQGAQAVIATLWKADDKSAATLMELFYRGRSMTGLSKAEALRKAQLQFVAGQAAGRARSHPYFWAPFVLMGDWR